MLLNMGTLKFYKRWSLNSKKGEILVVVTIVMAIVLIICLTAVSIQYFQINNMLDDIKYNLFYICQNSILAYSDELELDVYNMDSQLLRKTIHSLLNQNYIKTRKDINSIEIKELALLSSKTECVNHSNGQYEDPFVHIVIDIEFKSVIKLSDTNIRKISLHQDVKLSLMKY